MNFKISDKVVCVDNRPCDLSRRGPLKKGTVYVVEDAWVCERHHWPLVCVVGDEAMFNELGYKCGWDPRRFRLLSDVQAENRVVNGVKIARQQDDELRNYLGLPKRENAGDRP